MEKNVIITGASSYIALNLIQILLEKDYTIWAVIRPHSAKRSKLPSNFRVKIIELDLADMAEISDMGISSCQAVYHFAWDGVRGMGRDDTNIQEQNLLATQKCIDMACDMKIPYFIGIGSQAEYGITQEATTEETLLRPVTEYGKKKAAAYLYGMEKAKQGQINFVWARVFSTYGKGESPNTLLMHCISRMSVDQPINLSPCEHLWDYTYIKDVARALMLLMEREVNSGAYDISNGNSTSLKEFVIRLKKLLHSKSQLNFGAIPYVDTIPVQMNPIADKIRKDTGWTPQFSFEQGIVDMIKEQENNEKD